MYITIGLLVLLGILYGCFRNKAGQKALILKASATGMAVLAGIYGAFQTHRFSDWVIVFGLVCCMAADIILEIQFIRGVYLFGAAHLLFILAFCQKVVPSWDTLFIFTGIYLLVLFLFRNKVGMLGELKRPAYLYMAVLILMVAMAATIYLHLNTTEALLRSIGAFCFLVSDCVIAWSLLKERRRLSDGIVILTLYYAAVYLIGSAGWIAS
ncbi:MAG: lysoplasmalogenase [Dorea sp.]|nr:lysoplasmalogenase [Dorea sp.]MDY2814142.1 lysoplasmalogenase [Dorea sp.]